MTANSSITVWHLRDDLEGYDVFRYKGVSFHNKHYIQSTDKGFTHHDSCSIRIPTDDEINIVTGDYIRKGLCYDDKPDKDTDLKVMSVTDNRRGGQKHWRIVCE